jgi:hypothetical protein
MDLPELAREFLWLWERREGIAVVTIARRERTSVRAICEGLARAEATEAFGAGLVPVVDMPPDRDRGPVNEPQLVPLFPIGHFVPASWCPHGAPIRRGSCLCCMVCHKSGLDHLGAFQRPPPDKEEERKRKDREKASKKARAREPKLTRKERRARFFSDRKNRSMAK